VLVGVGAGGVVLLMLGAAATHLRRKEGQIVPVNLVIAAIAVFIAVMRFGPRGVLAQPARVVVARDDDPRADRTGAPPIRRSRAIASLLLWTTTGRLEACVGLGQTLGLQCER
jgi:hypothetical protein